MADSDGAPLPTGSYWIWPRHPKAGSWWLRPRGDDVFQATGRWPEVMGCHGSHGNGAIKSDKKRITGLFWASWACFFSIETEHDWTIQNHPFAGEADIFDPFPRDSRGGRIWANCGADAFEPYPKLYQNVNPINLSFLTWPRIETCAKKRPLSDWIEQAGPIVACRSRASHVLGRLVSPWQVSHPRTWPKFNSTSSDLKFQQHVQGEKRTKRWTLVKRRVLSLCFKCQASEHCDLRTVLQNNARSFIAGHLLTKTTQPLAPSLQTCPWTCCWWCLNVRRNQGGGTSVRRNRGGSNVRRLRIMILRREHRWGVAANLKSTGILH